MRSPEERITEVKRRIAKKERQKRLQQYRIEPGTSFGYETAATILGGNAALGYIVIGLLAFILGVCVTILCFHIRLMNREEETEEQKGDDADGTGQ